MPQKFATLPRNRNPFDGDQWGTEKKDKKEKLGLLGRVTGKKEGKKAGARTGSSGDLRSPNPFTSETSSETNPFFSHYKSRYCSPLFCHPYLKILTLYSQLCYVQRLNLLVIFNLCSSQNCFSVELDGDIAAININRRKTVISKTLSMSLGSIQTTGA